MQILHKTGLREALNLKKIRESAEQKRVGIRKKTPFWNWVGFLQHKASLGMEAALEILRTQKENRDEQCQIEHQRGHEQETQQSNNSWCLERKKIQASGILYEDKLTLLRKSNASTGRLKSGLKGFKWRIDSKGFILFTLPSG